MHIRKLVTSLNNDSRRRECSCAPKVHLLQLLELILQPSIHFPGLDQRVQPVQPTISKLQTESATEKGIKMHQALFSCCRVSGAPIAPPALHPAHPAAKLSPQRHGIGCTASKQPSGVFCQLDPKWYVGTVLWCVQILARQMHNGTQARSIFLKQGRSFWQTSRTLPCHLPPVPNLRQFSQPSVNHIGADSRLGLGQCGCSLSCWLWLLKGCLWDQVPTDNWHYKARLKWCSMVQLITAIITAAYCSLLRLLRFWDQAASQLNEVMGQLLVCGYQMKFAQQRAFLWRKTAGWAPAIFIQNPTHSIPQNLLNGSAACPLRHTSLAWGLVWLHRHPRISKCGRHQFQEHARALRQVLNLGAPSVNAKNVSCCIQSLHMLAVQAFMGQVPSNLVQASNCRTSSPVFPKIQQANAGLQAKVRGRVSRCPQLTCDHTIPLIEVSKHIPPMIYFQCIYSTNQYSMCCPSCMLQNKSQCIGTANGDNPAVVRKLAVRVPSWRWKRTPGLSQEQQIAQALQGFGSSLATGRMFDVRSWIKRGHMRTLKVAQRSRRVTLTGHSKSRSCWQLEARGYYNRQTNQKLQSFWRNPAAVTVRSASNNVWFPIIPDPCSQSSTKFHKVPQLHLTLLDPIVNSEGAIWLRLSDHQHTRSCGSCLVQPGSV